MLRSVFERESGTRISDRTWRRWCKRLGITNEADGGKLPDVIGAARLRKQNPYQPVTLFTVRRLRALHDAFPTDLYMDGRTLHEQCERALGRPISRQTMYRWGETLGIPFRVSRVYSPELVKIWAEFLVPKLEKTQ